MTVHDCIDEYKILGGNIFGHPRPCSWFGILWPKYSSASLKKAINEASARHNTTGYRLDFEIEEHVAQWCADHLTIYTSNSSSVLSINPFSPV